MARITAMDLYHSGTPVISIIELDISNCALNYLPTELKFLTDLEILICNNNNLETLEDDLLVNLPCFKEIQCSNNQLTNLPSFNFTNKSKVKLHTLNFDNNPLTNLDIKTTIDQLYALTNEDATQTITLSIKGNKTGITKDNVLKQLLSILNLKCMNKKFAEKVAQQVNMSSNKDLSWSVNIPRDSGANLIINSSSEISMCIISGG